MKIGKIEKNLREKRKSARLLFACEYDRFFEQSHCKFGVERYRIHVEKL